LMMATYLTTPIPITTTMTTMMATTSRSARNSLLLTWDVLYLKGVWTFGVYRTHIMMFATNSRSQLALHTLNALPVSQSSRHLGNALLLE